MNPIKSCGVIVFRRDPGRSFLLMRHVDRWDFPKGHVDAGETEMQCALRELEEETGISAGQINIDPDFRFLLQYMVRLKRQPDTPRQKHLIMFLGEISEPLAIRPTEHIGFEWFPWDPPHEIQQQTIDPLLAAVSQYWEGF